jgi:FtsP/CotA-like multicopper oxidase with cupredoxin domain
MVLSRRNFLAAGLALAHAPARAETAGDGFQVLRAGKRQLPLLGGESPATDVWAFDTAVIRAKQGQEFKLRIVNELDSDLWLHWFGVRGPSDAMTLNVMPGEANAADCVFTPLDAGTFWLGTMAEQSRTRDMGLVAMFIVEEASALAGLADLPLILDDWKIDDAGMIDPEFGDMNLVVGEGRLGNWFTINGAFRPRLPLAQNAFTRLRILNAANSRDMPLQFKGDDPLLIALDGQPVKPRNLGQTSFSLAPGQRADMLIGAAPGDTRLAIDLFEDVVEIGTLTGGGGEMPEIADNFALPPNPISTAVELAAAVSVPLVIEGGEKGGLKGAMYRGQQLDLRGLLEQGMAWAFNGAAGAGGAPLGTFKRGETVVIAVENRTIFEQPIHIHGHVWQEIERGGQRLEGEPFRDTAVISAKSSAKVALVADNPGTWAIQSLIAERADSGLTVAYVVA